MQQLVFDRAFEPDYGVAVEVAPGVRRLTARNAGPFTFRGTNSWLIGTSELVVIDPGPADEQHLAELLAAIGGRPVSHILVTHTHRDHSPGAAALARATGAMLVGEGPHRPARPLAATAQTEASADRDFRPDLLLGDGDRLPTAAGEFTALATPGHTANHLAFALAGSDLVFSGDHVMGWSTTIVAPPDGAMADYMRSLDRLEALGPTRLLPGHGGIVADGAGFIAGLRAHRKAREAAIVDAVAGGAAEIPAIVARVYAGLDPKLVGAAALSVLAHLDDLAERGLVRATGPAGDAQAGLDALFRLS
ncbi:MBL fold metallo-hydrolase [Methylobrevis albus]|uniref:MBL fold metallo-hydrolase n=1 Tax=Methylobrevis albus TaxID=2793297 RepID=A0A931I1B3_9HYPH|nr:MBL fold metallo-hydrolase [Methylobrevis albus]MBH0237118.1 MBL fold metallo-hydrolase [Methylobrevis albus]